MYRYLSFSIVWLLVLGAIASFDARSCAADKATDKTAEKLTDAGEKLRVRYADTLDQLRAKIRKELPVIDPSLRSDLDKVRATLQSATTERTKAQQKLDEVRNAQGLVEHAKGKWIGGAEKGIAQAEADLKKAKTDKEKEAANAALAKWKANKEDGLKALGERQASLDKLKMAEPQLRQTLRTADEALEKAKADETKALRAILTRVGGSLTSDKLDASLIKTVILAEATPAGLALFAQRSKANEELVDELLGDLPLMKEMLVAGGASKGKYGQAMQILAEIRKASKRAKEGHFHRLAVGVGLAHAEPITERDTEQEKANPKFVDPVRRYLHYEKAFLAGELDEAFPTLTTWEYCYVVDSYAPDAILTWGRDMLRNYRPDHVINSDYGWRYSGMVRTDVAYRHSNEYTDSESLSFFQNVCKNGGICGRRAFFGRYIVQAFGLPARPFTQPKHAAMVHWTPTGWVVNLGAGWPVGWFPEQRGPEFLLETQARKFPEEYLRVLRAEWIDTALEATPPPKKGAAPTPSVWKLLADSEQQTIVANGKVKEPATLGQELAEANESKETRAAAVAKAVVTEADKKIATAANGEISIPAGAIGGGNHVVKSFLGGQQLIAAKAMTVAIEVPKAGKYRLVAQVVTVHSEEKLPLTANGAKAEADVAVPLTVGQWEKTSPVEVTLTAGKNTLKLEAPSQSFALKGLTLTPVK